jgi:hypothetical protein
MKDAPNDNSHKWILYFDGPLHGGSTPSDEIGALCGVFYGPDLPELQRAAAETVCLDGRN